MTDRLRYARQMIIAEVGESGQARLEAATAALGGDGLANTIACIYAARAGVGTIADGPPIDEAMLAPDFLENAAARSMVAGSRAALAAMSAILFPAGAPRP